MAALLQALQGIVGLTAVGRPHMEDKPSLHLPGSGVFLLRLLVHGFPYSLFYGFGYIEQLIGPFQ